MSVRYLVSPINQFVSAAIRFARIQFSSVGTARVGVEVGTRRVGTDLSLVVVDGGYGFYGVGGHGKCTERQRR